MIQYVCDVCNKVIKDSFYYTLQKECVKNTCFISTVNVNSTLNKPKNMICLSCAEKLINNVDMEDDLCQDRGEK